MTSPFWNMSRYEDGIHPKKIDVILGGMETIGSAERSCDVEMMRDTFTQLQMVNIVNYCTSCFLKERVEAELEKFWNLTFFQE